MLVTAVMAVQAQVNFTVKYKRVNATTIDIIFSGTAQHGWHIYSTNIGEGGPTRATFGVDKIKGAKLMGSLKGGPGAKTMQDPIFEMPVTFYEGHATFTQRVKLLDKDYELKGYLKYGACNDENCLPPTSVDAKLKGADGPAPTAESKAEAEAAATDGTLPTTADSAVSTTTTDSATTVQVQPLDSAATQALWTPVIKELKNFGTGGADDVTGKPWYYIFFLGFVGGLVALFTPCVWPIIPMTVSFFLKRSGNRRKGIRDAITYGVSIVVIYVALGLIITSLFGANALNDLSTNAVFNILFFLMLVVFAASFFGGFEITLPSKWGDAVDSKAEKPQGCSASSSWPLPFHWLAFHAQVLS